MKDGSTFQVRPIRPGDEPGLLAFYTALSEDTRLMRFFTPISDAALVPQVRRDIDVNHARRVGLIGTHESWKAVRPRVAESLEALTLADCAAGRTAPIVLSQMGD